MSRYVVMQEFWTSRDIAPDSTAVVCYTRSRWLAYAVHAFMDVFGATDTLTYVKQIEGAKS